VGKFKELAIRDVLTTFLADSSYLRWARRVLSTLLLLLVAVLASRQVQELDIHAVRRALQSLSIYQLLIIQGIALIGVLAMSLYDWLAATACSIHLVASTLLRNAWIANTFNNFIGFFGLAGSGIRILLLDRESIGIQRAAAFSVLIQASFPVGLAVLSWLVLLTGIPGIDSLPFPAWGTFLALAAFGVYLPLYLFVFYKGTLDKLVQELTPQSAASLCGMTAISTLDWLLAASVAWLSLYFSGAEITWLQYLSSFVLASTLGILSLIPGGLGVFDGVLLLLLAPFAQVPEAIVSGLLIYRVCYYLVPWLAALYLGADELALPHFWKQSALARQWRDSRLPELFRLPLDLLASLGIRVLAYLTFSGGLILLVSAAFPTLVDRLTVLHSYVPLAAIEISHFLSVATGVLLIALSRGIAGQVRSAYYLTQGLLLGGALFSVLKGIDYEEALLLTTVALLLRQQRGRFYRQSYPLFSPRSLLWLTGLILSVVGFAWLGNWIHGMTPLSWEQLSRIAPTLEAPRFSRALLIAAVVASAFIGWSFYRRPKITPPLPDPQTLTEAWNLLRQYGGREFAHLVFLGDKSLLWSSDRCAFIQYGHIRERLVALGDPCGDPEAFDELIIAFRDHADRHGLTPCFYEVSEANIHRYHDAGFTLFKLGETATVELASFTVGGKQAESLRYGVNRAKREGAIFEVLEQPLDETCWCQLKAISDAWLAERNTAEKGFSLGNYNETYLGYSPIAVVKVHEQIVAFANLMPDYGKQMELSIDLMRHRPDAPYGVMDFLLVELILHAKAMGYQYFNLGMAPLGGVGENPYAHTGEKVARLAFEYGNRFYNYKGLRSYKNKFRPQWRGAYLAYPVFTPLPAILMDIAALIAGGYRRIFFYGRKRQ